MRDTSVIQRALALDPSVTVTRKEDPIVEALGYPVIHPYTEMFWLPVIGPSGTWMLRRLSSRLSDTTRYEQDITELAYELGLGEGRGYNSSVVRTLARLVVFDLASYDVEEHEYAVTRFVPPLPRRHVLRLSQHLQDAHLKLMQEEWPGNIRRAEDGRLAAVKEG